MSDAPKPKPPTYVPAPDVPASIRARYEAVAKVLAGTTTVSEAARELEMSRNHFQTLLHKGQAAMLEALQPKTGGRPPKPPEVAALQEQVARLSRENQKLRARVETIDRLLGVASDLVTGRVAMRRPRAGGRATAKTPDEPNGSEEPDPVATALRSDAEMKALGLAASIRATVLGASVSTLRRWRCRLRGQEPRVRATKPDQHTAQADAEAVLRELRGNIGAAALSKATGLSRRSAAAVKAEVLTRLEVERKDAAGRVTVTEPGIVRGFDAMVMRHGFILASCDAAIPYRTSLGWADRYDVDAVLAALEADFTRNGAPLVLRFDQAKQHKASAVYEMLRRWSVQPLHGPPHHPQYYGQLERQNREHRAWLRGVAEEEIPASLGTMRRALNSVLPRRALGWMTAEAAWIGRSQSIQIDREAFDEMVEERCERARTDRPECNEIEVRRLAIHAALAHHGVLKLRTGPKC